MDVRQVLGGRYKLLNELGSGGMAVVWRARDEVLGRPVAVKVLAVRFASDPQSRARIRDEARAAAHLSHPNIAQVYDYGEASESGSPLPYVVMELVNGETLQQRVASGPVPPRKVFRICGEVAAALAAAHVEGLVHRDIKMANIMVTPAGAKVVDFGIAAAIGQAPEDMLVGTPAYLAPERLTGGEVVPASDVYALGVLLYRLLAGGSPWSVESTTQMLQAHVYVEPAPLPPLPGVPPSVVDLIERCLTKDPASRPTADEVSSLLADAAEASLASGVRRRDAIGTLSTAGAAEDAEELAAETGAFRALRADEPARAGAPAGDVKARELEGSDAKGREVEGSDVKGSPAADAAADSARAARGGNAVRAERGDGARSNDRAPYQRGVAGGGNAASAGRHVGAGAGRNERAAARTTQLVATGGLRPGASGGGGSPGVRRRKRKSLLAAGAVATVIAAGLLVWSLTGNGQADRPSSPTAQRTASMSPVIGVAPGAARSAGAAAGPTTVTGTDQPGRRATTASGSVPSSAPAAGPVVVAPSASTGRPTPSASADVSPSPVTVAPPAGKRLTSPGGAVYATCTKGKATLTGFEPAQGYAVDKVQPGPALAPLIVFKNDKNRYRTTVTCVAGSPTPVVLPL